MGSICPNRKVVVITKPIKSCYTFTKYIGGGYFGKVHEAVRLTDSALKVAIKIIKKEKTEEQQAEIEIFKKMDHPYIAKLLEVFEDSENFYLVMECCDQGDLFDKIHNQQRLSERETISIARKILLAVNYLHSNGIVHRDLKPEHFLFQGSDIKMIDFGLSKKFSKHIGTDKSENYMSSLVGTAQYLAPEVIRGKYDQKCDL